MRGLVGIAVAVLPWLAACGDGGAPPLPEVVDATEYVDPRIGTGGLGFAHGSCFVGAVFPHGFAKPGPDTNGLFGTVNFQHYSGYFAEDNRIQGFSSVHMHGTGATDYGVLSLMPTLAFDASKTSVVDYEALFAKEDERAEAGYYAVKLASGIDVELTATARVAVHRYTMPAAGAVVVDLAKVLDGGMIDAQEITVTADEVSGSLHHKGGMSGGFGGYTIYFSIRATAPLAAASQWATGVALTLPQGTTTLAIGMSLVSLDGARGNLAAEVPVVDFDAVYAATRDAWRAKLEVVRLTGGSPAQRRTFYTSLYHAFLMPTVIEDHDRQFVLAGKPVRSHDAGWQMVSDMSLWDTYRTVAPLYSWLAPQSAIDQTYSLVTFASELGSFPKWPVAIGESGTMLGASAEIAIADTIARGAMQEVPDNGYQLLVDAAMGTAPQLGGRDRVADYIQHGYVPNGPYRSASLTTEYAHDDFALAQIATSPMKEMLLERSHGWRELYDPSVGFIRARNADGSFPSGPFDPTTWLDEYAEADAWQSLFMAGIHDPDGIAEILGGRDAAIAKLTEMFTLTKDDWDSSDESAANFPRRYYWAGNETDLNAPFLFAQLGRPDLTQEWVRWLVDTMYSDQPDGVPGNDDGGTMGAWYVFATLGLYPVAGSDQWILGAPLFPKARVTLGGKDLVIVAEGEGPYVKSVELDGVALGLPKLTQAQLAGAGELKFTMSSEPTGWGR
ncbi:MAG: glycoside hydrolase family 92 protein [Kofleriaceae bacterium]|nr:glycoside hydrolase family 92 protein [Kofleriaceae bacterium]